MPSRRRPARWPALLLAAGLSLHTAAHAADAFTDALNAAYPAYRAALFRTNSKAQAESEQAIVQARQGWRALGERFGARPPAPYDRDTTFAATLAQVDAVYAKAETEIRAGRLAEAHETLEEARDLMAELRRRNGVVVFSDHMNAYHAQMEQVLIEGPKMLAAAQGAGRLLAEVGALEYLARRLKSEAPAALAADAEYTAGQQAVAASVAALKDALLAGDTAAVQRSLGQLKGPYSRLFLKFG